MLIASKSTRVVLYLTRWQSDRFHRLQSVLVMRRHTLVMEFEQKVAVTTLNSVPAEIDTTRRTRHLYLKSVTRMFPSDSSGVTLLS